MKYVSLSQLPNKYPTLANYTKLKDGVVLLNGVYPEKNKVNFALPKFDDITPIANTTFRFIVAVAADENDKSPRYFTSNPFYNDITLSAKVNNPYFTIQALIGDNNVVFVNLKEYFELFEKLETEEKDTPVNVTKNIFLLDEETTKIISNTSEKQSKLNEYKNQLNDLDQKITEVENEINDNLTGQARGRRKLRRKRAANGQEELKELNNNKQSLLNQITVLETEIKNIKETNTNSSLLSEKSLIDYEELIRFIDYMINPSKFSVKEIENGNVKSAELIGKWEGEWIEAAKRRAAGETIEATVIDDRVVPNVQEEEKPKTVAGKIIAAIEKIPVVGLVVKAVKAVGNFFKKLFSDERLKTDILKVGEINGVEIYKFRYKFDKSKIRIGVIAQQLLKTKYSKYVSVDKETGYYVIDYNGLQNEIDIAGAIKNIQSDINSKSGGFSKLFKQKIFSTTPVIEMDNISEEKLKEYQNKKKIFGTRNLLSQTDDNPKFLLKNKKAAREVINSDTEREYQKSGISFKSKDLKNKDVGDTVLKRKFPKTKRS